MYSKLLTITEAAKLLGVSASTLRRIEKNEYIESYGLKVIYTPGGQRRYILDEIQELFNRAGFSGKIGFGKNIAILVRDLTKAFIDKNSKLSIIYEQQVEVTKQIVELAIKKNIPTVFSKTIYDPTKFSSYLWGEKFPSLKSLEKNSIWTNIHPKLKHVNFDLNNETTYISDFYNSPVDKFLKEREIDTIVLCGATTSGSIRATAIEGLERGYRVIIIEEAIGDRTQALQRTTLLDLNARYADVINLNNILEKINQLG